MAPSRSANTASTSGANGFILIDNSIRSRRSIPAERATEAASLPCGPGRTIDSDIEPVCRYSDVLGNSSLAQPSNSSLRHSANAASNRSKTVGASPESRSEVRCPGECLEPVSINDDGSNAYDGAT